MAYEQGERLSRNHQVDLYALLPSRTARPEKIIWANEVYVESFKWKVIKRRPFTVLNRFVFIRNIFALDKACGRIAGRINTQGYDLALVHPCMYTQAPLVLRHLSVPSIYFCQEPFRRFYEPEYVRSPASTIRAFLQNCSYAPFLALLKRADLVGIRSATKVLVNSHHSLEAVSRVYGVPTQVNYPGVDAEFFKPLPITKENMVLSAGRVAVEKQYELIIEALSRLPADIRPKLLIVGSTHEHPEEREYLSGVAARKGVQVDFQEEVAENTLVQMYNQAKIVICAAILEPFGLTPLEAMACGTPVVAVREGGFRETVVHGETGLLVRRDASELSEAVERLLRDDALRARLGNNGREYVLREWNWDRSMQVLERTLFELIG